MDQSKACKLYDAAMQNDLWPVFWRIIIDKYGPFVEFEMLPDFVKLKAYEEAFKRVTWH